MLPTQIRTALLPGDVLTVSLDPDGPPTEVVAPALDRLSGLPASSREEVERELYAFYVQEIEDGSLDFDTAQDQIDWENDQADRFPGVVAATRPSEVWPLVRMRRVVPTTSREGHTILRIEGDAAWDGEHGVVLHFQDGLRLLAVTGYGRVL